jgi:MinD-like ATPase involved in chromosome partitioning or flagellar assembly
MPGMTFSYRCELRGTTLADHETDQTPGSGAAEPVAPATGQDSGGTFRWPSDGLPGLFGQQRGVPDAPVPDVPVAGASPGAAVGWSQPLGSDIRPEEYYGQPGTGGPPGGSEAPDASAGPAGDDGPANGYGTVGAYGRSAGFDPPDGDPLDEYHPTPVTGRPLPPAGPHWQRPETADSLTTDLLLPGRHAAPAAGWRRVLYYLTGGLVRAAASPAEVRRRELIGRACTPVATGHHRVAVLSLKGGVGKTTTVMGLGSTLASLRGDRVIAVDANPDRGTLSDKLRLETAATVRDLLTERDHILRYADVRAFTTQAPSRLEVLASDRDPAVSVAFSEADYEDVTRVLEHYYSVCITDCGTGLLHSAMTGVLRLADQIVLVSSASVDGARSASATLDWLQAHGYGDLVADAVVVLAAIRPRGKSSVDLGRLEQHFAARCRAVVRIPYDPHLDEGAEVDLAQLSRPAADAYLLLAAAVGDGFSWPRHT